METRKNRRELKRKSYRSADSSTLFCHYRKVLPNYNYSVRWSWAVLKKTTQLPSFFRTTTKPSFSGTLTSDLAKFIWVAWSWCPKEGFQGRWGEEKFQGSGTPRSRTGEWREENRHNIGRKKPSPKSSYGCHFWSECIRILEVNRRNILPFNLPLSHKDKGKWFFTD